MNEQFLEVIMNSERISNLYRIGAVHRAEVEEFINEIVQVINNEFDDDCFSDFLLERNMMFDR